MVLSVMTDAFWVYVSPGGIAKVHRADCVYCIDTAGNGGMRTKAGNPDWQSFRTAKLAREHAERCRHQTYAHITVQCGHCQPMERKAK